MLFSEQNKLPSSHVDQTDVVVSFAGISTSCKMYGSFLPYIGPQSAVDKDGVEHVPVIGGSVGAKVVGDAAPGSAIFKEGALRTKEMQYYLLPENMTFLTS